MGGGTSSSAAGSSYVLYQYIQLLMIRDKLWLNDPEQCFSRLIRLYYLSMNHQELYACLRVLYAQTGMTPAMSPLCNAIRDLYFKPRTLKQLARVVIYNAISQQPALKSNRLPLPPALQKYVASFEP